MIDERTRLERSIREQMTDLRLLYRIHTLMKEPRQRRVAARRIAEKEREMARLLRCYDASAASAAER